MAEHSFFHESWIIIWKNWLDMSDNWTSFGPTFSYTLNIHLENLIRHVRWLLQLKFSISLKLLQSRPTVITSNYAGTLTINRHFFHDLCFPWLSMFFLPIYFELFEHFEHFHILKTLNLSVVSRVSSLDLS